MKVFLPYELRGDVKQIMLRAGYHERNDINTGKTSYIRRLRGDYYPRFHVYIEEHDGRISLDLHLDQKKPSYVGAHAHNADYDGSVVSAEASRIESAIGQRQTQPSQKIEGETSWWKKFFS
jgi:hypothetical protein